MLWISAKGTEKGDQALQLSQLPEPPKPWQAYVDFCCISINHDGVIKQKQCDAAPHQNLGQQLNDPPMLMTIDIELIAQKAGN